MAAQQKRFAAARLAVRTMMEETFGQNDSDILSVLLSAIDDAGR